jgi:hypothetical protein
VHATFTQKRHLVELLIDRVVVTHEDVEIRYVIPTSPRSEPSRFCDVRTEYFRGFEAPYVADLLVDAGKGPKEMPQRCDLLPEGHTPVMVRHHTAPPLPDALLRLQLGRGGRLGFQPEPTPRFPDDGLDWPPLGCSP